MRVCLCTNNERLIRVRRLQWQRPKYVSLAIILSTYFLSHCYYITVSVCTCSDLQFQHCRMHRRRIKPTEPHPRLPQTVRYALFGGEAREQDCRLSGHTGSVRATRRVHRYFARLTLHGECCISDTLPIGGRFLWTEQQMSFRPETTRLEVVKP